MIKMIEYVFSFCNFRMCLFNTYCHNIMSERHIYINLDITQTHITKVVSEAILN